MIDATDRQLLLALQAAPTMPLSALAERLDVSERTAARRFASLRHRGLVRVVGRTLPSFGGQVAWLVRATSAPGRTEAIGKALAAHPRASWVRSSHDGGEIVAGLVSPDPRRDSVLHHLPDVPGVRAMTAQELLVTFTPSGEPVADSPEPLDPLALRLLAELAIDGRATNRGLGHLLGVDETTISRRRRDLEARGILYYEADVAAEALGRRIDAMLWIACPPGRIRETGRLLRALPECQFAAATGGRTTLAVNVTTASAGDLLDLVETHLAGITESVEIQPLGRLFKRTAGSPPLP